MPFKLITSNRLENLAEKLADVLSQPLTSPLRPEIIVVQSKGMERWLSLQLAEKLGICVNVRFPFPNTFLTEVGQSIGVVTTNGEPDLFAPENLLWRIMRILPQCLDEPEFAAPKRYLENGASDLKRIQLSARIADLFDQYLVFRPEMIAVWENGANGNSKDERWQAELWRKLAAECDQPHRAEIGSQIIATLQRSSPGQHNLPQRVSVFGISTLPPFYLSVLDALAAHVEVNLFLMNPCKEYWGEIRSRREIARSQRRSASKQRNNPQLALNFEAEYLEEGNRLLASMGEQGRDFFDLILENFDAEIIDEFFEPSTDCCLTAIQRDILNLEEPCEDNIPLNPPSKGDFIPLNPLSNGGLKSSNPDDRSVQFHSCHNERREIEVLQDHLLAQFESHPDLQLRDVVVMAPDIEKYGPFIQSVFDLPEDDPRRLPYSLSDRNYSAEDEMISMFLTLLGLGKSRLTANEVLNILGTPIVSQRYGLSEDDLQLIQHWVRKTRIRWGADADYRKKLGLPGFQQNTWRAGLDRLLLGYALPAEQRVLYGDGIVPYDDIEGDQAEVLGRVLEFTNHLFHLVGQLERTRTLNEWREFLLWTLDTFFDVHGTCHALQKCVARSAEAQRTLYLIRRVVLNLTDLQIHAQFDEHIDIRSLLYYLSGQFQQRGYGVGYLSGGMTFCSMLPMRSIPFKVVCLIGMNSDAYPRSSPQLGFDLMLANKHKGDRSRRADDRYLFLESLLSARNAFYISYVGQSIKDNSEIPPSVVVVELLDYLTHRFALSEKECRDEFVTCHRLQGFSRKYFLGEDRGLFTYSQENLAIARSFVQTRSAGKPFIDVPLPEPEDKLRTVSVADLYRFLRHPVRFLFNKRLGIYISDEETVLEDDEPFKLEDLERYDVAQRLKSALLEKMDRRRLKAVEDQLGALPHGILGDHQYVSLEEKVDEFVNRTSHYLKSIAPHRLAVDLPIGDFRITGRLELLTEQGIVLYEYATADVKRSLRVWLEHLVHNSVDSEVGKDSYLFAVNSAKKGEWRGHRFRSLPNSQEHLEKLLNLYWRGVTEPLRFFPRSSWEFVSHIRNPDKKKTAAQIKEDALKKTKETWEAYGFAEKEDPYWQLCFGHEENSLTEDFCQLAMEILNPLFDHREELE